MQKFSVEARTLEIRRDYYLKKLISKKHNGLIKVITGMRRCGKSYLLFTIFRNYLLETGVSADHIIDMPLIPTKTKSIGTRMFSIPT